MASKFITLLCIVAFISCRSTKSLTGNLIGNYWNQENNTQISIYNNNSFVYKNLPNKGDLSLYTCCDTISFGEWKSVKSDMLEISTPEFLNIPLTRIEVEELEGNSNNIEFIIESPLEEFYKKKPSNRRDVNYKIELYTNSTQFELTHVNKLYNQNVIRIDIPKNIQVTGFVIEIIPTSFFGGQNMGYRRWSTLDYEILKKGSSKFQIKLPDVSYDYLTYLRLDHDYVFIKGKDILFWDGKEYKRK